MKILKMRKLFVVALVVLAGTLMGVEPAKPVYTRQAGGVAFQNVLIHNVSDLVPTEDGAYSFRRVPLAVDGILGDQGKRMNMGNTGVEIRFVLKGEKAVIRLAELTGTMVARCLVYYGDFIADWPETDKVVQGRDVAITIRRSPRMKLLREVSAREGCRFDPEVVRLVLPHGRVGIRGVTGDVEVPPPEKMPRRVYLAYGSSITHGSVATEFPLTYPSLVGAGLGADVRNLGFAGSARLEKEMADYLAGEAFDCASFEMGINILGMDPVEFEKRVRYLLDRVSQTHPHARILAIDVFRVEGSETMQKQAATFREIVARVVRELARPNLVYVNGLAALPSSALLSEGFVHPSPEGHRRIAEFLVKQFGVEGLK